MSIGEFLEKAVFWVIPLFLLCSWMVNHKTESGGDTSAKPKKETAAKAQSQKKEPSSRDKEGAMTDKDMTGV